MSIYEMKNLPIICACANNSMWYGHDPSHTPCRIISADLKAKYWIIGIATSARPYGRFAYVWRSYNTLKGCHQWSQGEPVRWEDMDWSDWNKRHIVINPLLEEKGT